MALHGSAANQVQQIDHNRSKNGATGIPKADGELSAWLLTQYNDWERLTPVIDYIPDFRCVGIYNNTGNAGTVTIDLADNVNGKVPFPLYLAAGAGLPLHVSRVYAGGTTIADIILWK